MHKATASSFADPADVRAFERCKAKGKTDKACFKVGDNGIGQFGANTAQDHTPMVALHEEDMVSKWGSVAKAAHKRVTVRKGANVCHATVEDRCGVKGRIDLNPAACKDLHLVPPILTEVEWEWA